MLALRLTDREELLLRELNKCRMMLLKNIKRLFYPEMSDWAVYKRLDNLDKEGYIRKEPYIIKGRKAGACVYLDDKGLKYIGERSRGRRLVDTRMHPVWVALTEAYLKLMPYGWQYEEGRIAKRRYVLNRNSRLHGLLMHGNVHFGVYVIPAINPKEETIEKMKADIALCTLHNLRSFIIFYFYPGVEDKFKCDMPGVHRLLLLKYPEGVNLLARFATPGVLKNYFHLLPGPPAEDLGYPGEVFAEHMIRQNRWQHYVTELATNDLVKRRRLSGYTLEKAKERGHGVFIFVPEGETARWRQEYPQEPFEHFRFIEVPAALEVEKQCSGLA